MNPLYPLTYSLVTDVEECHICGKHFNPLLEYHGDQEDHDIGLLDKAVEDIKELECDLNIYFITMTYNAYSETKAKWFDRVCKQLSRVTILKPTAVIEHIGKNIHCHLLCYASNTISRTHFKAFVKRHPRFDIKKCNEREANYYRTIYMRKEFNPFEDMSEFYEFYSPKIKSPPIL
jgi:hypothetical protein